MTVPQVELKLIQNALKLRGIHLSRGPGELDLEVFYLNVFNLNIFQNVQIKYMFKLNTPKVFSCDVVVVRNNIFSFDIVVFLSSCFFVFVCHGDGPLKLETINEKVS